MVGAPQAEMLAIPQINEAGDTLAWYAPFDGVSVPWTAATEEERAPARSALQDARLAFFDYSSKLLESESRNQDVAMLGRMLPSAIHIPDESHIYLVDGRPVITFWGFDPLDAPPDVDVIRDLRPAPPAPIADLPPPPMPPAAAAVVAPVIVEPSRPWWRWLLWLLPLLLLFLLLWFFLFGLRGCDMVLPYLPFDDRPADTQPLPDGGILPTDPARLVPDGVIPGDGVTGRLVPGDGTLPSGILPDGTLPNGTLPVPELGLPDGKNQAPPETPNGEEPTPTPPDATQPPPDLPPPDAAAQDAPPGEELVIPEEALREGNTDFLNGRWRSHSGLADRKTGDPLRVEYALKDGKGSIRVYRQDGTVCEGQMDATVKSGSLVFDQKTVALCPDGSNYNRTRVVCTPGADGKAHCQGINSGDGSDFQVAVTR
jgi:hypothetical protein